MNVNFLVLLAAAIIPMIIGFIWYHPKVLGTFWMQASGVTEDKLKSGNMALIFCLAFLFSFFMAFVIQFLVIHQMHTFSILGTQPDSSDPNSEASLMLKKFMELFGTSYRTFKHGALHGTMSGIFLAMPLVAITALFERRSFKYIAVHAGYWIICFGLMGGVICAFS
jgi:hypothetical protein